MQAFTLLLQTVTIWLICRFEGAISENNRKWLEIDNELYRVEPEGKYTWKEAVAECAKERSTLIFPRGDYSYAKLKDAIKHNFKHYSHFWTSNRVKRDDVMQQIGLSKNRKDLNCYKFDNSSIFKFLPDNCDDHYGFICQRHLLHGVSTFSTENIIYYVQPDQVTTCEEAYEECKRHQFSLLMLVDYAKNKLLQDYVFNNYGPSPSFWFGFNNETHYNCATPKKGQKLSTTSRLGFICERAYSKTILLTTRHLILIVFVATSAIMAIFVYIFARCFCHRRVRVNYADECIIPRK